MKAPAWGPPHDQAQVTTDSSTLTSLTRQGPSHFVSKHLASQDIDFSGEISIDAPDGSDACVSWDGALVTC